MPLDEKQLAAVDLLVNNPKIEWGQMAETLGVSSRTLYNWRQLPEFNSELSRRGGDLILGEMYRAGLQGDVGAGKLFLQATGRLSSRDEDPIHAAFDIGEAEIKDLKNDIYEEVVAERKKGGGKKAAQGGVTPGG